MAQRTPRKRPNPIITKAQWVAFFNALEGPKGCNFRKAKSGNTKGLTIWTCTGGNKRPKVKAILKSMGLGDKAELVLAICEANGGYCDCEVVFNVRRAVLGEE